MQFLLVFALAVSSPGVWAATSKEEPPPVSPVTKVMQLLADVEAKIKDDTKEATKMYIDYSAWCHDSKRDYNLEIGEDIGVIQDLDAVIGKALGDISTAGTKIGSLADEIAGETEELSHAAQVRKQENAVFRDAEKELVDTVDTLDRAINVLRTNLSKASNLTVFMQTKVDSSDVDRMVQMLSRIVDASSIGIDSKKKLIAFAQTKLQGGNDAEDDAQLGAPAKAIYESKSESIVDVLDDLRAKAQEELRELRKQEVNAQFAFDTRKKSLTEEIDYETKEMDDTKVLKSGYEETEATADGNRKSTASELHMTQETLRKLLEGCQTAKSDYEAASKSRAEELRAIQSAIQFLKGNTENAEKRVYKEASATSLLQLRKSTSRQDDDVDPEVVTSLRALAKKQKSTSLSQLASRVSAEFRLGSSSGEDPFKKVNGMIRDMIKKLQAEASSEESHKQWCDLQTKETSDKKDDLEEQIDLLTAKIDSAHSSMQKLKDETAAANDMLVKIATQQKEMDKLRKEEHMDFVKAKADLDTGLQSVRYAMKTLNAYYNKEEDAASFAQQNADSVDFSSPSFAQQMVPELGGLHVKHTADSGAGNSIIGILQLIEADFGKNLATVETDEANAAATYEKTTQNNELETMALQEDVKYKVRTTRAFEKHVSDKQTDRENAATELDSVTEYAKVVHDKCTVKPETYEERVARRQEEIEGLNSALESLGGEFEEGMFMQTRKVGFLQRH